MRSGRGLQRQGEHITEGQHALYQSETKRILQKVEETQKTHASLTSSKLSTTSSPAARLAFSSSFTSAFE